MKNHTFLLAIILLAIATTTPIPHAYSSTLTVTVSTDKTSYTVEENITVYGNLTYNSSPVPDWPIALEVQDPYHTPVVTRTPQTNTNGTYNATFKLPTNAKLGTYTVYVSSGYKGETTTNNTKFKLIQITQTTVTIEGEDYTITVESNATIANVTATRTNLNFTSSGPAGEKAYINATIPVGLNKTEIKVFIDDTELIPPPYPIITTNGTHYFIYLEFTLSTHDITIKYAIADIATTNITLAKTIVAQGYIMHINATIQNQGNYTENFNVTAYANTVVIDIITNITITSGNTTIITFNWNTSTFAKGSYTISAKADKVPDETDTEDNNCTDGTVEILWKGDVNKDNVVDGQDIVLVIEAIPSYPGHPKWNPYTDINNDNIIDGQDAVLCIDLIPTVYP